MAPRIHLLVVANQTVDSPDLHRALQELAEERPVHATLLMPIGLAEREEAHGRLDAALAALREADIPAEGMFGAPDPVVAVQEAWDPARFDEVLVSTLAAPLSQWMRIDIPHRIARLIDCPVRHLETREPEPERPAEPPRTKPRQPLLVSLLSNMHAETRREAQ
jgi:hypothetical protein